MDGPMAFQIPDDPNDLDIYCVATADAPKTLLTSLSRQDKLFALGYEFEAASARAAMLDGLCLGYLMMAKGVRKIAFDQRTLERLKDQRITLGQVKDALIAANALHDPALEALLTQFVKDRNHLTHHAALGVDPFDLKAFFDNGKKLAVDLYSHMRWELKDLGLT